MSYILLSALDVRPGQAWLGQQPALANQLHRGKQLEMQRVRQVGANLRQGQLLPVRSEAPGAGQEQQVFDVRQYLLRLQPQHVRGNEMIHTQYDLFRQDVLSQHGDLVIYGPFSPGCVLGPTGQNVPEDLLPQGLGDRGDNLPRHVHFQRVPHAAEQACPLVPVLLFQLGPANRGQLAVGELAGVLRVQGRHLRRGYRRDDKGLLKFRQVAADVVLLVNFLEDWFCDYIAVSERHAAGKLSGICPLEQQAEPQICHPPAGQQQADGARGDSTDDRGGGQDSPVPTQRGQNRFSGIVGVRFAGHVGCIRIASSRHYGLPCWFSDERLNQVRRLRVAGLRRAGSSRASAA